jgi:hypothetical protein
MPIFARAKLTIEEDCLLPSPKIWLTYSGPNPQKAYAKIMEILKTNLQMKPENIQERDFKWDRGTVPEKFSGSIEAFKDFDRFTYMLMWIDFNGEVRPSKEFGKEGTFKVSLDSVIRTDYPQDTVWERSLVYEIFRTFWHKAFYQERRYVYREQCRDLMLTAQREIKSFLNILPKE